MSPNQPRPASGTRDLDEVILQRRLLPLALTTLQRGRVPAGTDPRDVAALTAVGMLQRRNPSPRARRLLDPIARPRMVTTVRATPAATAATIWRWGSLVTIGATADGREFRLAPGDADLLAFTLAGLISLRARPRPGEAPARLWRIATIWSAPDGSILDEELEVMGCADGGYRIRHSDDVEATGLRPAGSDRVLRLLDRATRIA